jgi:hypothetical protein
MWISVLAAHMPAQIHGSHRFDDEAIDGAMQLATEPPTEEAEAESATDAATEAASDATTDFAIDAARNTATVPDAANDAANDAADDAATDAGTVFATDEATDAATYAATYEATYTATYAATDTITDAVTYATTDAATEALLNLSITGDDSVTVDQARDVAAGMLQTLAATWLQEKSRRERDRARCQWTTVRLFVQVYPYALHWYEYVCRKRCAPGGTWAERDRAAFEADFK